MCRQGLEVLCYFVGADKALLSDKPLDELIFFSEDSFFIVFFGDGGEVVGGQLFRVVSLEVVEQIF